MSLQEAAECIVNFPKVHYMLEGESGIGKSSIKDLIMPLLDPEYLWVYFDCAQKDLGDVTMPAINRELKVTEYFPNAVFQFQAGRPLVIIFDEYKKASRPVQNMMHPLLEAHNPRLGDMPLPKGSIILLTGNIGSMGVGDNLKAHSGNRMCRVRVRKPTSDEWINNWASPNNIEPAVIGYVKETPQVFASFEDPGEEKNERIFNPKRPDQPFASGRSLAYASNMIKGRAKVTDNALLVSLRGVIGLQAAQELSNYIHFQDMLPSFDSIVKSPKTAKLVEDPGALMVMVYKAVGRVTKDNLTSLVTYLGRAGDEYVSLFFVSVSKQEGKQSILTRGSNPEFKKWVIKNNDLI
jgi:MoxR-like ATPase